MSATGVGNITKIPFCHRMKAEHCVITWIIEHYHLFHENQESCNPTIASPKFYASDLPTSASTLWSLSMYLSKGKETDFGAFLHREIDSAKEQPEEVIVHFRIGLFDANKNLKIYGECRGATRQRVSRGFATLLTNYEKTDMQEFLVDGTLTVYCEMIVIDCSPQNTMIASSQQSSLATLSNDIAKLFKNPIGHDSYLNTEKLKIPCHKFILGARSSKFFESLQNSATQDSAGKLSNLDDDLLLALLLYIYNGDLKQYMLAESSLPLGLYEAAASYGLWGLHKFLSPKELAFITTPEFVTFSTLWIIPNFDLFMRSPNLFITKSSTFTTSGNVEWYLTITKNMVECSDCIGIYAYRNHEQIKRESFVLEVSVVRREVFLNNFNNRVNLQCLTSGSYGIDNFLSKDAAQEVTSEGTLTLKISLSVCNRYVSKSAKSTSDCCVIADYIPEDSGVRTCEPDLKKLSDDLKAAYENQLFCDLTFQAQNEVFKVHECILNVRAGSDSSRLKQLLHTNLDPSVVKPLIYFLYTGTTISLHDAFTVYSFLCKHGILELKKKVSAFLLQNMTTDIVCPVIQEADVFDDNEFKDTLISFICRNLQSVLRHPKWTKLLKTNKNLAEKILSLVDKSMDTSGADNSDNSSTMDYDDTVSN